MADIFEIVGKVSLDGIDKAEKGLKGFSGEGEKSASKLSKLGSVAKSVGKGLLVGAGAVTAGAVGLVKQVSSSYGALQQSIGGIETLFKDSAQKVIENANNAYTTAGISANDYMQQVTSFSASLLQSLGGDTEQACNMADMAIRDMADNANKMGTPIANIQNAYQGFAKQNYSMLDNLKLGYGGTQKEMYRLMEDATKLDKTFANNAVFSLDDKGHLEAKYSDIVKAINIIQQNMGITGTTAKEAGETIEGSFNSLSASWQNFVAGLGNPDADMAQIVDNLAKGLSGAINNVIPIINNMVSVLPTVMDAIIGAIGNLVPTFVQTFTTLITQVIDGIVTLLPTIIPLIVEMLTSIINALVENLPLIMESVILLVTEVLNSLSAMLPELIPTIVQVLIDMVNSLVENLPTIMNAVLQLLLGIVDGIVQALPILIQALPQIITGIVQFLIQSIPQLIQAGITLLMALIEALPVVIEALVNALPDIITSIINTLINNIPLLIECAIKLFMALVKAIPAIVVALIKAVPKLIVAIMKGLAKLPKKLWDFFVNIWGKIKNIFSGVGKWFGDVFGGAWNLIKGAWNGVTKFFSDLWGGIKNIFSGVGKWFKDVFDGVVNVIKTPLNWIIDGLNFLIGGLNMISFDVPDWVPLIGGKKFGFNIPKIPHLAKGGVVDEPTVAEVGEDGKEAIVPLENNVAWITTLAEKLISELKSIILPTNKGIDNVVSETPMKEYQVSFNTQFDTLNNRVDRLIDLIGQYLPNIADNMDREIVLDGNRLAVGMSRRIDSQLGKISTAKGRGNV